MYRLRFKIKILPFGRQTKKIKPSLALFALALIVATSVHPVVYANDLTAGKILSLTNDSRAEAGKGALTMNATLSAAALAKANDMLEHDYFSHTSPTGTSPWYWLQQAGYQYHYAGENLAINYQSAATEHKAWMKSPTHRANILNAEYTEVGIAVVEGKIDGESALLTVVMFGQPKVLVPPQAREEPGAVPEAVKGVSSVPASAPTDETVPLMPQFGSTLALGNTYTFLWVGIFELVLILSALYFFYKDAIEYVALDQSLRLALSGDGHFGSDDREIDKKPIQSILVRRE